MVCGAPVAAKRLAEVRDGPHLISGHRLARQVPAPGPPRRSLMPPAPAAQRRPPAARSGATRPFVLVLCGAALLCLGVVAVRVLGGRRVSAFRRSLELSQEWAVAERNLAGVGGGRA